MKSVFKLIYVFFSKFETGLSRINRVLLQNSDSQYKNVQQWYKDDPHSLKRSSFDYLDADSVVFDLGGYEGQWTSDIYSRYRCRTYVFEPVKEYYSLIKNRFFKNDDISVFPFGLGNKDIHLEISLNRFASSVVNKPGRSATETIFIKDFLSFINEQNLNRIDLVKINIEGSEYELLSYLLSSGFITRIQGILVQFHNFEPGHKEEMQEIKNRLSVTHKIIFEYEFVWEFWSLK